MLKKPVQIERKQVQFNLMDIDRKRGRVDAVINTFGIVDLGKDIVHPGAFTKTISERAGRIRVLDQHSWGSVRAVIGRPILLQELDRDGLPDTLKKKFEDATGGLMARTQFAMDTQAGSEIFNLIDSGMVDEYSIGFDILQSDFSAMKTKGDDGEEAEVTIRNIREVRLWEYSVVTFGMNQGTETIRSTRHDEFMLHEGDKGIHIEYADSPQLCNQVQCTVLGQPGITAYLSSDEAAEGIDGFQFSKAWSTKDAITWEKSVDLDALKLDRPPPLATQQPIDVDAMKTGGKRQIDIEGEITAQLKQIFTMAADTFLITKVIDPEQRLKIDAAFLAAMATFTAQFPGAPDNTENKPVGKAKAETQDALTYTQLTAKTTLTRARILLDELGE